MRTSAASEHRLDRPVGRLNPYMAYCGDPDEGAALVFAESAKEARRLAYDTLRCWFDAEWIGVRVRRLRRNREYLMGLYDGHAVCDDPPSCDVCGTWGAPADETGCENCRHEWDGLSMPPNYKSV